MIWMGENAGLLVCDGISPGNELQLFSDPETGLVAVLDGRIDGRAGLIGACRAAGFAPRTAMQAELILRAYQTWGEACPGYILGEYAFILWDSVRGCVVAARDSAGMRPLFYAQTGDGHLLFATSASQLLREPTVRRTADITGMVDFLIGRGYYDPQRTPCAAIRRVPAAHTLITDARGVRLQKYWSISADDRNGKASWNASLETCTTALLDAILGSNAGMLPVGISLSGGWDSGAIFTLWQWMRNRGEDLAPPSAHTYYGDDPADDERTYVAELLDRWSAPPATFLHRYQAGVLDGLEKHVAQLGMPDFSPAWRTVRMQGAQAREAGVRTLLNGEGGNTVFQSSQFKSVDLICGGRLRSAGCRSG